MIIALSGYAGAGKDTVADALMANYGIPKYAWADTLRRAAAALNPIVGISGGVILRYNDVLEAVGYNEAKFQYPEVREILQRLGTEVGRNLISDTVWVDATLARIEREGNGDADIVITDTRFPNEAVAVKERGGFVVRVERPGVEAANAHPSETALDDWNFDLTIINAGPLETISAVAEAMYDDLKSLV